MVAATLGLTPVESQTAAWLAEGRIVREIAGALGYTERSVRWYLHQIYHKQGLAGQVDLVRLVGLFYHLISAGTAGLGYAV